LIFSILFGNTNIFAQHVCTKGLYDSQESFDRLFTNQKFDRLEENAVAIEGHFLKDQLPSVVMALVRLAPTRYFFTFVHEFLFQQRTSGFKPKLKPQRRRELR
jgi:hypothetical protein